MAKSFTAAALRAALRRQIGASGQTATMPGWSEADGALARALYAALALDPQLVLDLPAAPEEVDGLPELDWARLSLEQVAMSVRDRCGASQEAAAVGEGGTGERPSWSTVREEGSADSVSFAAFMASRARRRADQAQALLLQRERFAAEADRLREEHFAAAAGLFDDQSMPQEVRAQALRHHREELRRALSEHSRARDQTLGVGRAWYGNFVDHWRTERVDRADYAHAIRQLYDDRLAAHRAGSDTTALGPDPVLISIPGARRYRDAGTMVYTHQTSAGLREMFRLVPDEREVIVRSHDHVAIEAAVMTAHRLDGPPLTFVGSPAFRSRCEEVARCHGYEVVLVAEPGERQQPPAAAQSGARSSGTQPGPVNAESGAVDLDQFADSVAAVKQETGIELVVALDPKHGVSMRPVYHGHVAMQNEPLDLVFLQCPGADAIAAIVLPRGTVPADAVAGVTRLSLEVRAGMWEATFERTDELHAGGLALDPPVTRGR